MTVGELVKRLQSFTDQDAEIGFFDWQGRLFPLKDSDIVGVTDILGRFIGYDILIEGESWGNVVESNMGDEA